MKFTCSNLGSINNSTIIFPITQDLSLNKHLSELNTQNLISDAMKADKTFEGKDGQILHIYSPGGNVILLGIGGIESLDTPALQQYGGKLAGYLNSKKIDKADIIIDSDYGAQATDLAAYISIGVKLCNYSFNKYFVDKKDEHQLYLNKLDIQTDDPEATQAKLDTLINIVDGTMFARDLSSEPANTLYPKNFAQKCQDLEKLGVKVRILDAAEMKKYGMNALLGVAQGSEKEPYTVIMEWNGQEDNTADPIVLVGKGVTFDTGGINLKPSSGMGDMKYDMSGAGVVTGTIHSLAMRKAPVRVVGAIGLVENMPSGSAQRPSDVVKTMSGQTVEVDNTDAEGRLVLSDVLWWVQENYKPRFIIDLATLTGAIVVALGDGHAGLFSNDDELASQLSDAGQETGEKVWRLPVSEFYDKQVNSAIADVKNTGQPGRGAGSITAAQFLHRFIQKGNKWAHLDIAGVAWNKFDNKLSPKGATGFGVRLINQLLMKYYEVK